MALPELSLTIEALTRPEWLAIYSVFIVGAIGLTAKQRQIIRDRDGKCIDPDPSIKHSHPSKDEIDHLIPKEFAETVLGMAEEEYNDPSNLARRCFNHHRGHPNSKHPDVHKAVYEETVEHKKGSIRDAITAHRQLAVNNKVYWNVKGPLDSDIRKVVAENNEKMDKKYGGRLNWWPWGKNGKH